MDDNSSLMARLLMGLAGRAENVMGRPPVPTPPSDVLMNQSIVPRQLSPESGQMVPLTESGGGQMLAEMLGRQTPPQPSSTPSVSTDQSVPLWARFLPQSPTPAENLSLAANIIGGPTLRGAMPGIRAFHGSPHKFDRFDMSRIGTGEGAQAYGHGLYFAENPSVAEAYKRTLGRNTIPDAQSERTTRTAERYLNLSGWDREAAASLFAKDAAAHGVERSIIKEQLDAIRNFPGHMYEVNIRANPEQFLDWEKPFAQQSPDVRRAVSNVLSGEPKPQSSDAARGYDIYDQIINRGLNPAASIYRPDNILWQQQAAKRPIASQMLNEAGIPGIKYLDQGSRRPAVVELPGGKFYADHPGSNTSTLRSGQGVFGTREEAQASLDQVWPKQTSNYVLFDDSIIDILKRYGLMGGVAAPPIAGALMDTGTPQQQ